MVGCLQDRDGGVIHVGTSAKYPRVKVARHQEFSDAYRARREGYVGAGELLRDYVPKYGLHPEKLAGRLYSHFGCEMENMWEVNTRPQDGPALIHYGIDDIFSRVMGLRHVYLGTPQSRYSKPDGGTPPRTPSHKK
jgi:hypothetical protein